MMLSIQTRVRIQTEMKRQAIFLFRYLREHRLLKQFVKDFDNDIANDYGLNKNNFSLKKYIQYIQSDFLINNLKDDYFQRILKHEFMLLFIAETFNPSLVIFCKWICKYIDLTRQYNEWFRFRYKTINSFNKF